MGFWPKGVRSDVVFAFVEWISASERTVTRGGPSVSFVTTIFGQ